MPSRTIEPESRVLLHVGVYATLTVLCAAFEDSLPHTLRRYLDIRLLDPMLRECPLVYVSHVYFDDDTDTRASFVVAIDGMSTEMVHRLPYEIENIPVHMLPTPLIQIPISVKYITSAINPMKPIPQRILKEIHAFFPDMIGLRCLVWGHITILFSNELRLNLARYADLPSSLGGLSYSFEVWRVRPIVSHSSEVVGCKLRIQKPEEREVVLAAWTAATHGFVDEPHFIQRMFDKVVKGSLDATEISKLDFVRRWLEIPHHPYSRQVSEPWTGCVII